MSDDEPPAEDEFADIKPAPRPRSPLVAVAAIALGLVVLVHLRADIRYAFQPRAPKVLGQARTFGARAVALLDNTFVTIAGQPDRRDGLTIEPAGQELRQSFFRLLGTGTRVLVRAADTHGNSNLADRWSGRLRRFDALPYASSMRDYYAHVKARRYLQLAPLGAALSKGENKAELVLTDRRGESFALPPADEVDYEVTLPDQLLVRLSHDQFPSEQDARHELERLQLSISKAHDTKDNFEYFVAAPAREAMMEKLSAAGIEFAMATAELHAPLGDARLEGGELSLPAAGQPPIYAVVKSALESAASDGQVRVPFDRVTAASVAAPIVIPHDAFVLTEGETPAGYFWTLPIGLLLLAFVAFNFWYLWAKLVRS